jgi:hypothetical protein
MTALTWDDVGEKRYEAGLSKAVLYLSDGSAVPWNGFQSVNEASNQSSSPVYYDGRKIADLVSLGDFTGSIKAYTYPDEFLPLTGIDEFKPGIYLGEQRPNSFNLSYRSKIGNDVDQDAAEYIHIFYNLTVKLKDRSYQTIGDSISPEDFEWDISGISEDVSGFSPTCHITINTSTIESGLLEDIEEILYGSESADASLISMQALLTLIGYPELLAIKIIDNGDGSWTALVYDEDLATVGSGEFEIDNANAYMVDSDTYRVSSSLA